MDVTGTRLTSQILEWQQSQSAGNNVCGDSHHSQNNRRLRNFYWPYAKAPRCISSTKLPAASATLKWQLSVNHHVRNGLTEHKLNIRCEMADSAKTTDLPTDNSNSPQRSISRPSPFRPKPTLTIFRMMWI